MVGVCVDFDIALLIKPLPALSQRPSSQTSMGRLCFYLKTANGKYAAIQAEYSLFPNREAEITASIYFNPSGSQNLQYDGKKRINK